MAVTDVSQIRMDSANLRGVVGDMLDWIRTSRVLHVEDQKDSGTSGGTFTQDAWQDRDLNVVVTNGITGASLASNTVTLPAGTYRAWARAPAVDVDSHAVKLRDTTNSSDLAIGSVAFTDVTSTPPFTGSDSFVMAEFTLSAEADIKLQHRCTTTQATNGFGAQNGFGVVEVFAQLWIEKIK